MWAQARSKSETPPIHRMRCDGRNFGHDIARGGKSGLSCSGSPLFNRPSTTQMPCNAFGSDDASNFMEKEHSKSTSRVPKFLRDFKSTGSDIGAAIGENHSSLKSRFQKRMHRRVVDRDQFVGYSERREMSEEFAMYSDSCGQHSSVTGCSACQRNDVSYGAHQANNDHRKRARPHVIMDPGLMEPDDHHCQRSASFPLFANAEALSTTDQRRWISQSHLTTRTEGCSIPQAQEHHLTPFEGRSAGGNVEQVVAKTEKVPLCGGRCDPGGSILDHLPTQSNAGPFVAISLDERNQVPFPLSQPMHTKPFAKPGVRQNTKSASSPIVTEVLSSTPCFEFGPSKIVSDVDVHIMVTSSAEGIHTITKHMMEDYTYNIHPLENAHDLAGMASLSCIAGALAKPFFNSQTDLTVRIEFIKSMDLHASVVNPASLQMVVGFPLTTARTSPTRKMPTLEAGANTSPSLEAASLPTDTDGILNDSLGIANEVRGDQPLVPTLLTRNEVDQLLRSSDGRSVVLTKVLDQGKGDTRNKYDDQSINNDNNHSEPQSSSNTGGDDPLSIDQATNMVGVGCEHLLHDFVRDCSNHSKPANDLAQETQHSRSSSTCMADILDSIDSSEEAEHSRSPSVCMADILDGIDSFSPDMFEHVIEAYWDENEDTTLATNSLKLAAGLDDANETTPSNGP